MASFRCTFCKVELLPDCLYWYEWPLLLVLMRPYVCPHCSDGAYRPVLSLKRLCGRPSRGRFVREATPWQADEPPVVSPRSQKPDRSACPTTDQAAANQSGPAPPPTRRKRRRSRSRTSSESQAVQDARRRSQQLAGFTGTRAPVRYQQSSWLTRQARRLRRRIWRLFGKRRGRRRGK